MQRPGNLIVTNNHILGRRNSMVSQEVILTATTNYFAADNAIDVDGFVNAFAADASIYNAGEVSPLTGRNAIRQVADQSLLPLPEGSVAIERIFIVENGAAVFY